MYGSARSTWPSPPPSPAATVFNTVSTDDDPRAAIAGLLRATPQRQRSEAALSVDEDNDDGDYSNNSPLNASPFATSAAAAAANVIARGHDAGNDDDTAVWRSARAAVDAVAAATNSNPAKTTAADAARVVARAASARAEHAAEVARAAAVHAVATAAFARARSGPCADKEASAAAMLADDAADVATRAAAAATVSAKRAHATAVKVSVEARSSANGRGLTSRVGLHPSRVGLPPTPTHVLEGSSVGRFLRGALPPSPAPSLLPPSPALQDFAILERLETPRVASAVAARDKNQEYLRNQAERFDRAKKTTPISLGKPQRVLISEHDALLFDATEAKSRLREGRRRAEQAFKGFEIDAALKQRQKQNNTLASRRELAVSRALAFSGASVGGRRGFVGDAFANTIGSSDRESLPNSGVAVSRSARDAMDRAAVRSLAKRLATDGTADANDANAASDTYEQTTAKTPAESSFFFATTKQKKPPLAKPKPKLDPACFDVSFTNAHSRWHGEMNKTDRTAFELDVKERRARREKALGVGGSSKTDSNANASDDFDDETVTPKPNVGPRPTHTSLAAAAAALERKALAAKQRAERMKHASASVGSFPKFKASPAPSPTKPLFGSDSKSKKKRKSGSPLKPAERPRPASAVSRRVGGAPKKEKGSPAKPCDTRVTSPGGPAGALAAARAALADLTSGEPVIAGGVPKSNWHELAEAGRRSVARVRAYQSSSVSGSPAVSPEDAVANGNRTRPTHERYEHYKMMGFGGMGGKTSWAR